MKVLVLPSWYPNAPSDVNGIFFRDQVLALIEHGHKVGVVAVNMRSLLTVGRRRKNAVGQVYEFDEGIPTYRKQVWGALPRIPYGNYWLWRRAARALLALYVQEQGWPDVIHAHSMIYAGAVAVEWGRQNRIPVVLTEHSSGFARRIYRPWQLALAEEAAVGSDTCISVSPALGELLGDQLPRSHNRWVWVPNIVAARFYGNGSASDDDERSMRFLNLAIMTKNKGQLDLLDGFARAFRDTSGSIELWMCGDGPLRRALEARAQELGISQRVRFLGKVPPGDVPAILAQVDVMVVASHYETFGVVAAEALMAGVPVVATRCGGPECIVTDGDGYLVPPGDPQALAVAMVEMADSMGKFDRKAIIKRARSRFSGEVVARQLTGIYKDVSARYSQTGVTG